MITREAAGTIYTHAGPEIGVASTKAFTCQLSALFILAMYLGSPTGVWTRALALLMQEALRIPGKLETVLAHDAIYEALGRELHRAPISFSSVAASISPSHSKRAEAEGNLLHSRRGLPAGEMKHGPNALIDEKLPWWCWPPAMPRARRAACSMRRRSPIFRSQSARRNRGGPDNAGRRTGAKWRTTSSRFRRRSPC